MVNFKNKRYLRTSAKQKKNKKGGYSANQGANGFNIARGPMTIDELNDNDGNMDVDNDENAGLYEPNEEPRNEENQGETNYEAMDVDETNEESRNVEGGKRKTKKRRTSKKQTRKTMKKRNARKNKKTKKNRKTGKKGGALYGTGVGANCYDPNFSIYNTRELTLFPYRTTK